MRKKRLYTIPAAAAAVLTAAAAAKAETRRRQLEEQRFLPPGEMVTVDGKSMHVRTVGSGTETIVMLPGLGTPGPSVDFYPLAKLLAQKGLRCVIPDPFGYGFSDDTEKERTAQNMIEEIRSALKTAGINGPYWLFGHSIAGLYIRIWAHLYPEEVKGLITEDVSVPEQFGAVGMLDTVTDVMLLVAPAMRFLGKLGVSRALEAVDSVPGKAAQGDEKSKQVLKYLTIRNNFPKAVGNEYRSMKENAALTAKIGPPQVPVLVFVATGEGSAAKAKFKNGFSWVEAHEKLADSAVSGRLVQLPGMHYLHWSHAGEIAEETERFIGKSN